MEISLSQQFPDLPFTKEADQWLASITDKTIEEQLKERKVKSIVITRLKCQGILSIIGDNFIIQIKKDDSPEEKVITLGHEVAHTFDTKEAGCYKYGPAVSLPKNLCQLVENFCDVFTEKWLAINGKEKVASFLQQLEKE